MTPEYLYKLSLQFLKLAEQATSAGMLFYCSDGTVLLTKRSKAVSNPRAWDIQGGRADNEDDSESETAKREAHEELGTLPSNKKIIGKHLLHHKNHDYMIYVYEVSELEKQEFESKIKLDFESTGFRWFDVNNLPADTHVDLTWVPEFIQAHS